MVRMSLPWKELAAVDLDPDDPSGRDPELIREVALPLLDLVQRYYFRTEVEGIEYVPEEGPFIAIANHNGGPILPDLWVMVFYWWSIFGLERPAYALIHDAPLRIPVLRNLLIKLGALRACRENAEKVLDLGGIVLAYPGGELDCLRSFSRRHIIDFHGRTGFVKLAMQRGVPLLPVVNAGGHEVYVTLFSSRLLARLSGLERLTRVKTVPVNLGLPWGIWATGFVPFLPLPAKLSYKVGKPVRFRRSEKLAQSELAVQRAYLRITDDMQGMLDDLASKRRFPIIG
jgi:1-acyl-sn-glycerol-3-phosphate acyltransferase